MGNERFIFWFWEIQVDARKVKKHFHCLIICIYFLPYFAQRLPNDSLNDLFFQTLLCMTLISGDWSDWSHFHFISPVMPDKAAFERSAALCTALPGKPLFFAPKDAPSCKEWIIIFIQTNEKIPTSGQEIWLCFMLTSTAVSMIQSRNNNFIQGLLSDVKLQDVFIHLELCYTAWKLIFKNL